MATGRSYVRIDEFYVLNYKVFIIQGLSTEFWTMAKEKCPDWTDKSYVLNYSVL